MLSPPLCVFSIGLPLPLCDLLLVLCPPLCDLLPCIISTLVLSPPLCYLHPCVIYTLVYSPPLCYLLRCVMLIRFNMFGNIDNFMRTFIILTVGRVMKKASITSNFFRHIHQTSSPHSLC